MWSPTHIQVTGKSGVTVANPVEGRRLKGVCEEGGEVVEQIEAKLH